MMILTIEGTAAWKLTYMRQRQRATVSRPAIVVYRQLYSIHITTDAVGLVHDMVMIIRRAVRLDFYTSVGPAVADLVANLDDTLFASVSANDNHVLMTCCLTVMIARTALGLDVMIACSPLGVTTDTFYRHLFKDMY